MKALRVNSENLWLGRRLNNLDWTFIRGSAIISAGMLMARLLGLGFSLLLASVFSPEEFGKIQYTLAIGSILAVVVHPFGQHVIARFISSGPTVTHSESPNSSTLQNSKNEAVDNADKRQETSQLATMLNNCWILFTCLLCLTLLVTAIFVWSSPSLGMELIFVVFGIALFYAYWGVSRGYMRSGLLTSAYLGSNVVQLIVVCILIWWLELRSSALALSIYGLSYVPVIFWLQFRYPLPLYFDIRFLQAQRRMLYELLRFALPVTLSHAAFMLFVASDLIFLNRMVGSDAVGQYALAKTLSTAFAFIPMGISTLLMPQIASNSGANHRQLLLGSVVVSLSINIVFLAGLWFMVEWFVSTFFGLAYLAPIYLYLILAFGAMLLGIQSIVASVYVGKDRPEIETMGRVLAVGCLVLGCWLLIPRMGEIGAALSVLIGSIAALVVYVGHGYWGFARQLNAE